MIDSTVVELSRLQFAIAAMYHFIVPPLTMGLSFLLGIMESAYVMTGKQIWRRMPCSGACCSASTSPWVWAPAS